jgi:flagellar protein FliO/FliZ
LNATVQPPDAHPRRIACVWALWVCGTLQCFSAAWSAPFAAPEQVAPSSSSGGLLRVVIALLVVLGAVVVAGRFARRMRGFSGGTNSALQVVGQLPVGPRERAVLIRVGERQLLLGVAPGNVRMLHVFDDAPIAGDATALPDRPERPTFKSILRKSLAK